MLHFHYQCSEGLHEFPNTKDDKNCNNYTNTNNNDNDDDNVIGDDNDNDDDDSNILKSKSYQLFVLHLIFAENISIRIQEIIYSIL